MPPTRAEVVATLRDFVTATSKKYVGLGDLLALASRIEAEGIAPEPCRGDGCQGCPECAVSVAELARHAPPAGTAVHIQATRDASGLVLNAVIDRDYWLGYSDVLALDGLLGRLLSQPSGSEFKLSIPGPV